MEAMYWIDVLGNISTVASLLAVLFVILTAIALVVMMTSNGENKSIAKKRAKKIGACAFILVAVFTPSTKSMYMIYGVGGTTDYLKENPTAKQLPDKIVMALDKWVDSQIEDESKDKDK